MCKSGHIDSGRVKKFCTRFTEQVDVPYVLHPADLKEEDGIVYLPLYMMPFL